MKIQKLTFVAFLGALHATSYAQQPNLTHQEYYQPYDANNIPVYDSGAPMHSDRNAQGAAKIPIYDYNAPSYQATEPVTLQSNENQSQYQVAQDKMNEKDFILFFDLSSSQINSKSGDEINRIVDMVQRSNDYTITVRAHADAVGQSGTNESLSRKRASNVVKALVGKGLNNTVISHSAYGENDPITTTNANTIEKLNRRVEVNVRAHSSL